LSFDNPYTYCHNLFCGHRGRRAKNIRRYTIEMVGALLKSITFMDQWHAAEGVSDCHNKVDEFAI
jgi:hypothetical protein